MKGQGIFAYFSRDRRQVISQEGKANRDDSVCAENLTDGKILGEGKMEKRKKKSLSESTIQIVMNSVSSSITSLLVALKSMATGSGKVWGTKLSPKVQRKRVKSKVALLKVRKNLLAFLKTVFAGLPQRTGKPAGV